METKNKTSHTPGPWKAESDGRVFRPSPSLGDCLIAVCGRQAGEEVANARLIAAAPDLLAEAKSLLGQYGDVLQSHMTARDWDNLRDIVAKAEGQEAR